MVAIAPSFGLRHEKSEAQLFNMPRRCVDAGLTPKSFKQRRNARLVDRIACNIQLVTLFGMCLQVVVPHPLVIPGIAVESGWTLLDQILRHVGQWNARGLVTYDQNEVDTLGQGTNVRRRCLCIREELDLGVADLQCA